MFKLENRNINSMYINGLSVLAIYMNGVLIWPDLIIELILSCFYNGYWIDEYPWTDDTPWTD